MIPQHALDAIQANTDYREALLAKAAVLRNEAVFQFEALDQARWLEAKGRPTTGVEYWEQALLETDNKVWEIFKILEMVEGMSYLDFTDLVWERKFAWFPVPTETDTPF